MNVMKPFIIQTPIHRDERGSLIEGVNEDIVQRIGQPIVQTNYVQTGFTVVRGLHFQIIKPQMKVIQVLQGTIIDVAVDLETGEVTRHLLSEMDGIAFVIPEGYAHGFSTPTRHGSIVVYHMTEYRHQEFERTVDALDGHLKIDWGVSFPSRNRRDQAAMTLEQWKLS